VNCKTIEDVYKAVKDHKVSFIQIWFTDVLGVMKSFAIRPSELEEAMTEGMGFDGSSIEGFARIEESDMIAKPDPTTFQLLPWRPEEQPVARMFCDILQPDASPYPGDPRYVFKRMLAKAAEQGYTYYLGPELEYFYFKSNKATEILDEGGYFDAPPLDLANDWRRQTIFALEKLGVRIEYSHHEVAASQHEIDMRYDEGLVMADKTMTLKATVKAIALMNGVYATFMPKPIFGINGSGMHTHQGPVSSVRRGQELYRRTFEARPGDHRRLQPVGQLLQAPGAGLRGSGLRGLGPPQPLRPGPGAHVQARQGSRHPLRIPGS
jgi:glutamine synthetase